MQKGFAPILLLITIVAIIIIVGGIYYFGKTAYLKFTCPFGLVANDECSWHWVPPPSSWQPSPTPKSVDETTNWKTYTNTKYGFSFNYPSDWGIVFDQGNNIEVANKAGDNTLMIGVKNASDNTKITTSGVEAGDIEKRGTAQFLGKPLEKIY